MEVCVNNHYKVNKVCVEGIRSSAPGRPVGSCGKNWIISRGGGEQGDGRPHPVSNHSTLGLGSGCLPHSGLSV